MGDFIERYIFPGGEPLHVSHVLKVMSEAQLGRAREVTRESVVRAYRLYLAGSAMSFEQGWISLFQMFAARPSGDVAVGPMRGAQSRFPFNREYMYTS